MTNEELNAIAKLPNGNVEFATAICRAIRERADEIAAEIDAAAAKVTADNWNSPEMKAAVSDFKVKVEDLRDGIGKRLLSEALDMTEAKRILTAIDARLWSHASKVDPMSAYGRLSAKLRDLKTKIMLYKTAAAPTTPKHTYAIMATMTDKQLDMVLKAMLKIGIPFNEIAVGTAQSDKAVKEITRWFNENTQRGD